MNYIREINYFEQCNSISPMSPAAQLLWYRLMHCANKKRWPERFSCRSLDIALSMGVSEKTVQRARKELIDKGLIQYSSGVGRKCGEYILLSIGGHFSGTTDHPEWTKPAKKEKNQKKEIYNNKYLYKQNTDDAYVSKYDYKEIERLACLKLNRKDGCDVS